jgi:signal transduction histidine kinase
VPDRSPDLEVAVRRIVAGFRGAAAGWLALLAAVGWGTGRLDGVAASAVTIAAVVWAVASVRALPALSDRRGPAVWGAVAADVAVAAGTLVLPVLLDAGAAAIAGGYPFSAVVIAAWLRGMPAALAAALALAGATVARASLGPDQAPAEVVSTVVFYAVGAAVSAWAIEVLRRTSAERDAAEAALVDARAAQAIAEERATMGAHLHDSVLQTLALIQRRSDDAVEVAGLARGQERALRDWLAGRREAPEGSFAAALAAVAAEVEATHRLAVEVVSVGDAPVDARLAALLAAAREALVNAARHAGVPTVSVFGEVGADGAAIYVRDRGTGFDPAALPDDRRGVRGSIVERVRAAGGEAVIRSSVGAGTEVELRLPAARP